MTKQKNRVLPYLLIALTICITFIVAIMLLGAHKEISEVKPRYSVKLTADETIDMHHFSLF